MIRDEKIWIANTESGENISIIPKMANRHGLVAGATGTGKTVTLKVMAESFSEMGVPVFMADVKGDIAGMMNPGTNSEDMQKRIAKFGLAEAGFEYKGYPVTLWDIYGKNGIPLRTTISEMGPLLLSRILGLNDLQSDILSIIFKIADDSNLLLIDTKDLKAMLAYVDDHSADFAADYGKISSASIGVITRAIVSLETEGADLFFGEPALNISDWLQIGAGGKGMINVLASDSLIGNGKLYSTFLLWMLSELFETLPEVGDMSKPKMVFFFDEAHLLFKDTPKALLEKIEQVVKLIRSKGVGVYFCTQNPRDIPDGVLAQLSNKVQHGLRAYTPSDQKAVRAAADSFRVNPDFDTFDTILNLGTGEAVVSFLQEDGVPAIASKVNILPPQCSMAAATDAQREQCIKESLLYSKYATAVDPDSAYEFLQRKGIEDARIAEEQKQAELEAKEAKKRAEQEEKEAKKQAEREEREALKKAEQEEKEKQKAKERAEKEALKKEEKEKKAKQQAMKSVGNSVAGTVGRELGKNLGGKYGKFGKTLGGNVGASLGRGLLSTLFKK
ncbi:MAG: DUF853 domain-containing protein [Lachnospiraceae bacterium]|nr:DUF853 domain-containing protein [Lachnospiraceae bacterium]